MEQKFKQITSVKELIGKTIERTGYSDNEFFLFFTDKTFCIFKGCGYDENDVQLSEDLFNTEPNRFNVHKLLDLGFLDKDYTDEIIAIIAKKHNKEIRNKEIAQLKELKAKYPNI